MTDLTDYLAGVKARANEATRRRDDSVWVADHDVTSDRIATLVIDSHNAGHDGTRVAEVDRVSDAVFIARAHTDVPRLHAMVEAVLALHVLHAPVCSEPPYCQWGEACDECHRDYPCPTVRAMTAVLDRKENER